MIHNHEQAEMTFPIAIVVSRFNRELTEKLLEGALGRLRERAFSEAEIEVFWVPGAVEIPLVAKRVAECKRARAVVCLGAVIRGDTDHYTYVCHQVSDGCQRVALETGVPVLFGILTTDNEAQALKRAGGAHGNKGRDVVDAAVEMVSLLAHLVIQ